MQNLSTTIKNFNISKLKSINLKKYPYPIMKLLVDKLLCFSFDLYNSLLTESNRSFVFSPLLMFKLLGILLNAAEGDTKEYLQSLLYQKDDLEKINQKIAELDQAIMVSRNSLNYKDLDRESSSDEDNDCVLNNFIFYNNEYSMRSSFRNTMKNTFDIISEPIDLQNPKKVIKHINKFVSDSIKGYVPNFLTKLDENLNIMIINTIFFKGSWYKNFSQDTIDENFYATKDPTKTVPMIKVNKELNALDNENYQAIQVLYSENEFSFLAVMPKKDQKLSELSNDISKMGFNQFISTMQKYEVNLKMPKFKIETETEIDFFSIKNEKLNKVFSKLNELSILENKTFKEVQLVQKAIINVDENGNVAAAERYTFFDGIRPQLKQISITFDKPFLYFIIKSHSGNFNENSFVPLFMGQYYGN